MLYTCIVKSLDVKIYALDISILKFWNFEASYLIVDAEGIEIAEISNGTYLSLDYQI